MAEAIITHEHANPQPFIQHMTILARTALPAPEKTEGEVTAYVNCGRWVAECPEDKWAVIVSSQTPLFFCGRCKNAAVGGRWRTVVFPADRVKIEYHLLKRQVSTNRNWYPDEKVTDLIRENAARGVV